VSTIRHTVHDRGTASDGVLLITPSSGEEQEIDSADQVTSITITGSSTATQFIVSSIDSLFPTLNPTGASGLVPAPARQLHRLDRPDRQRRQRHKLGDNYGQVSIAGAASDKLDFTSNTHTISFDGSAFTDTLTGDSASATGMTNAHINVTFSAPGTVQTAVKNILSDVTSAVTALDGVGNELSSALPLLDPSKGPSIDKLTSLLDSVSGVSTQVSSALGSHATLSGIATDLNSIVSSLPDLSSGVANPLKGLTFSTGYGSNGSDLLVYLTATLTPTTTSCAPSGNATIAGNGNGCVTTLIPLAFGTRLDSIGIALDSDPNTPGVQPPTFSVQATIGASLALGVDVSSPAVPFLKDGGHIDLVVNATLSAANLVIAMGLLSATISSGTISLGGSLTLQLTDHTPGDNGITPADLTNSPSPLGIVDGAASVSSPITLTASIDAGLNIAGSSTVPLAHATLQISFASDFTAQTVQLFGTGSQPLQANVQFQSSDGGISTLLDSFSNGFTSSFSNAGPNEIMSMLSQIEGFFTSIASQSFLAQQIPFTSITLGQVLSYAQEFKHQMLDPLFKSGDSTKPDGNGDGKVDFNDFNFSSIQGLLDRLDAALGLAPNTLTATYNPSSGALTFDFSLDQTLGIGTGVNIAPPGGDIVESAPLGGGTPFTLTASGGGYKISYNGGTQSAVVSFTASVATVSSAVTGLGNIPAGTTVACESGAASCDGGPYKVSFDDGTSAILTPNEVQQLIIGATGGTFSISTPSKTVSGINFDVSLATFQTDVNSLLGAGVADVACANGTGSCNGGPFQIVFDHGSAGTAVPLIAIDSSKLTNTNNLVQVLTVPAGTGNFWVAYPDNTGSLQLSDKLAAGQINALDVKSALNGLSGLHSKVSDVTEIDGDTTVYVITLTGLTPAKTISVAGGFSLSFAANLGGLAGVQTTGDVIPLARLVAAATFGINLNPSSSITVSPGQFQAGPRVDATTTHDGGKSISLDVIRPGAGSVGTVQILTVNAGGGTFSLGGVSGIAYNVDKTTLINDINGINAAYNVQVDVDTHQQAGTIYTITFAIAGVAALSVDGSSLTARNEVQQVNVVNADAGNFTLTFGGA
jgi:hypothetical protein